MKTNKLPLVALLLLLALICGLALGAQHFVEQKQAASLKNQRIVVTTTALAEIFDKLEIPLVGVPKTDNKLPARYQKVATVGGAMSPSVEKIASLKPTEVYAVSTLKDQYDQAFKKQKFNLTYLDLDSVSQLKNSLTTLGDKYHRQKQAQAAVAEINRAISRAKKMAHGKKHPKVLILMGLPGAGYMILTNKSYLGNLVQLAGGKNLYQSRSQIYLDPSNEQLANQNPDVILRLAHALPNITVPQFEAEFKQNPVWQHMDAVKNKRVYDLEQPTFNASANLEVPQALAKLGQYFYPGN